MVGLSSLAPGASFRNTLPCAIVMEGNPKGPDSELRFESFQGNIEEGYALNAYRQIAADRMPQPGYVAYRGGNWAVFNLELKFRVGSASGIIPNITQITPQVLDQLLIDMESKGLWCLAQAFPLMRTASAEEVQRTLGRFRSNGLSPTRAVQDLLSRQTRNDPPIILVIFGAFRTIRGYVTNITVRWEGPFHPVSMRPYGCTVNMSIQRILREYPTWESIRNAAGRFPQTAIRVPTATGQVSINLDAAARRAAQRAANNAFALSQAESITGGV